MYSQALEQYKTLTTIKCENNQASVWVDNKLCFKENDMFYLPERIAYQAHGDQVDPTPRVEHYMFNSLLYTLPSWKFVTGQGTSIFYLENKEYNVTEYYAWETEQIVSLVQSVIDAESTKYPDELFSFLLKMNALPLYISRKSGAYKLWVKNDCIVSPTIESGLRHFFPQITDTTINLLAAIGNELNRLFPSTPYVWFIGGSRDMFITTNISTPKLFNFSTISGYTIEQMCKALREELSYVTHTKRR